MESDGTIAREETMPSTGGSLFFRSLSPQAKPIARLGIVHGYGDHSGRYAHFMNWMAKRCITCLAFDFRGHGRSSGRRGYVTNWQEHLDDLSSFLARPELAPDGPLFLLGHSHGALVVASAAVQGRLPAHIRGVILSSPYFRNRVPVPPYKHALNSIANLFLPWLPIRTGITVEWLSSDSEMCRDRQCDPLALGHATPRWFSTMQHAQRQVLDLAANFRLPLLMLTAGADPIADPAIAQHFFQQAPSPDKTLRHFPPMAHEILRERGREAAFDEILLWITNRIS